MEKSRKHWRDKLKENSEKYEEYKKKDRERAKIYRSLMTEERKAELREKTRERVKKYRKKKKESTKHDDNTSTSKTWTRNDEKKQLEKREKWRISKQKQRSNYSAQKKRRILENRRKKYNESKNRMMKVKITAASSTSTSASTPTNETESKKMSSVSNVAKRKAVSRARAALPKDPAKFASTVSDIIRNATPKKSKALQEIGICKGPQGKKKLFENQTVQAISGQFEALKESRKEKDNKIKRILASSFKVMRKYRLVSQTTKLLGVSRKVLTRDSEHRKKRNDVLSADIEQKVKTYYTENSTTIPDQKRVTKKLMTARKFVDRSLNDLHKEFSALNPEIKVSKSLFCKLRPKFIDCAKDSKYRQCLCEYCTNIELKLKTLNTAAKKNIIADKYSLRDVTVCKKEGEHHYIDCINRKCQTCGVNRIDEHLQSMTPNYVDNCSWLKWESVTEEKRKGDKVVKQSKKVLKKKEGTIQDLITELKEEAGPFALHLFNAKWQNDQFKKIRTNPPKDTVIQVLDFAENFTCDFQNEVQSAHWTHETCTVHPIVNYYTCEEEDCSEVVTESVVVISDDLKHDHNAVHKFIAVNDSVIRKRNPNVEKYIQWSDGCASQYKSKGPFIDISCSVDDYGIPIERNFFGSRHGKGPSDGESAVIKREARNAVKAGRVIIANAKDLYSYAKENLEKERKEGCTHFRRTVLWVGTEQIQRDRGRMNIAKTLKGTRTLHRIKCVQPGSVLTKIRSCFCESCMLDEQCPNENITGTWREEQILQV